MKKKTNSELKNTITTLKNSAEGFNNNLTKQKK